MHQDNDILIRYPENKFINRVIRYQNNVDFRDTEEFLKTDKYLLLKQRLLYLCSKIVDKSILSGSHTLDNLKNQINKTIFLFTREIGINSDIDIDLSLKYFNHKDDFVPEMSLKKQESSIIGKNSILGKRLYYDSPLIIISLLISFDDFKYILERSWPLHLMIEGIDFVMPVYFDYMVNFEIRKSDCGFRCKTAAKNDIHPEILLGVNSRLVYNQSFKEVKTD